MSIILENILFSKTNIDLKNDNFITFEVDIRSVQNGNDLQEEVNYLISMNDFTEDGTITTPHSLLVTIPKAEFNVGNNEFTFEVEKDNVIEIFNYVIIGENRDTFTLERRFQYDKSIQSSGDFELVNGEGFSLKGTGEINLQLPTDGKSKVENFIIDSIDDVDDEIEIEKSFQLTAQLEDSELHEVILDLDEFKQLLYVKAEEDDNGDLKALLGVLAESKIRFLISNDNLSWYGFDGSDWIEDYEMTKSDIQSLTSYHYKLLLGNKIYTSKLYIKVKAYSENPYNIIIGGLTLNYKENQAPFILNPSVSPNTAHDEYVTISADVVDYEGDSVEYRILIKKANEDEFYIADDWQQRTSEFSFFRAYNYPYFNVGENLIKIEVRDQRGSISEWTGNLIIVNTAPTIVYTYDDFSVTGTIYDEENDEVTYRLFINDVMKHDYLPFKPSPRTFLIEWDSSDLIIDQLNDIKIEAKDSFEESFTVELQVMGKYRGLLFMDENGEYYTTDKGDLIKLLKLDSLIAGQTSDIKKVTLVNNSNYSIEDVVLTVDNFQLPDNAHAKIDYNNSPFEPKNSLIINEVMENEDEKDFYIVVYTEKGRGKFGSRFKINVSADILS